MEKTSPPEYEERPSSSMGLTPIPTITKVDDQWVLHRLATHGWMVEKHSQAQLVTSIESVRSGHSSAEEFAVGCNALFTKIPGFDQTPPIIALLDEIGKAIQELRERREADVLRAHHLSAIQTAQNLEPRSTKIVVAVQEVTQNILDENNNTHMQADTLAIRDFLVEDIIPFLTATGRRQARPSQNSIRQRKTELRAKIELQKKNTNFHLLACESGIQSIDGQGNYHIKTNHLPKYAAASALEILLRAYHALLSDLDSEDDCVSSEAERLQFKAVAENRKSTMVDLFKRYGDQRVKALKFSKSSAKVIGLFRRCSYNVWDTGSKLDTLYPKTPFAGAAQFCEKEYPIESGHLKWKIDMDGHVCYRCKSKKTPHISFPTSPKQCWSLCLAALSDMRVLLAANGLVWKAHFQPHVERIDSILTELLPGIKGHPHTSKALKGSDDNVDAVRLPKTMPLVSLDLDNLSNDIPHFVNLDGQRVYFVLYNRFGRKTIGQCMNKNIVALLGRQGLIEFKEEYHKCELVTDLGDCKWVRTTDARIPRGAFDFAMFEQSNNIASRYDRPCYLAAVRSKSEKGTDFDRPANLELKGPTGSQVCKAAWYLDNGKMAETQDFRVLCLRGSDS